MIKNTETTHTFNKPKRKTLLGIRRSAWLEILLALVLLLAFDVMAIDGTRYWDVNPHPFWFIVLLMATKYGTKEALVAAILSSIALLFGNMPEQLAEQDSYAYALYVLKLPLLWLVSAVIFGELRQMHMRERDDLENALVESEQREQHIAQSYQWVKQLKDLLELRMAGQLRSSISAYHAAKSMESLSPNDVMRGLEELVSSTLHPECFSVYDLTGNGLEVSLTHGWKDSESYTRNFGASSPLYQSVVAEQRVLCVANNEHEQLLSGQAMLVGPLLDQDSGEVVGMLKIEKLGFTDLHLSNIEAFSTICEWAGMAIVNARKYQTAKEDSIINPDHNLLTYGYFKRFSGFIASLAERVGFDVSAITVKLSNPDDFDDETRGKMARALSESVDSVLRNVDLAFDHQAHSEEYSVVLPATNRKGADTVVSKIQKQLTKRINKISKKAEFTFSTQVIYENRAKK
ncbi:MAG: GAF domain-containing protein [Rickettsiales bacterium]